MVDGGDQTLDQHALDVLVRRRGYDDKVVAVLLRARERLLLAVGLAIAGCGRGDPLRTLEARIRELLACVHRYASSRRTPASDAGLRGSKLAGAATTRRPSASKSWSS
jgi:hypothetical protein